MKKEDILAKAREEKKDEMEDAVRDRSAVWMAIAMVIAAGFFVCVRDEGEPIMDLAATVGFSMTVCCIYRAVKLKKLKWVMIGILCAAVTVFAAVRYFMGY